MSGQRRYSDQEFAVILRKALELEERTPAPGRGAGGMTLEEIQAVARDVGVNPEQVARAARLLPSLESTVVQRLAGGASKVSASYQSSRVLQDADMSRVVSAIREALATQGAIERELDVVTWKSMGDVTQMFVTLRPESDGTEVQVRMDRDAAAILTWFFTVAAFLFTAGALGNSLAPPGVLGGILYFLTFLVGGLGAARALWGRNSRLANARFQELLELVSREVDATPALPAPDAEDRDDEPAGS